MQLKGALVGPSFREARTISVTWLRHGNKKCRTCERMLRQQSLHLQKSVLSRGADFTA